MTKRLDDENIEFQGVKFTTFLPDTQTPDLEIVMKTSVFNLKTQVLYLGRAHDGEARRFRDRGRHDEIRNGFPNGDAGGQCENGSPGQGAHSRG